jgi:hypothetical protein
MYMIVYVPESTLENAPKTVLCYQNEEEKEFGMYVFM